MAVALPMPLLGADRSQLPYGRRIELTRRGTTFVREVAGPRNAPTVLLLHGWVASAGLNWFQTFAPLAEHFNIVAPDLRGHARGVRARRIFRLADCADDCAATLETLGTGPVIAVGYSMGGPVAQLLWQRHRDLVDGIVLCATGGGFMPNRIVRRSYQTWMIAVTSLARIASTTTMAVPRLPNVGFDSALFPAWGANEIRRHDWRMVIEAGQSISTYNSRRWIGDIDVPAAVVCTTGDRAVAPSLQLEAADAIPGATVHPFDDGHLACANAAFGPAVVDACLDVSTRIR